MYNLNLSIEEQQALKELLECSISELHTEIVHTDHREFKEMLKSRKQLLVQMLKSLQQEPPVVQPI